MHCGPLHVSSFVIGAGDLSKHYPDFPPGLVTSAAAKMMPEEEDSTQADDTCPLFPCMPNDLSLDLHFTPRALLYHYKHGAVKTKLRVQITLLACHTKVTSFIILHLSLIFPFKMCHVLQSLIYLHTSYYKIYALVFSTICLSVCSTTRPAS